VVNPEDTRIAQAHGETDRLDQRARAKLCWKGKLDARAAHAAASNAAETRQSAGSCPVPRGTLMAVLPGGCYKR
jgi:hypothetical protein